MYLPTHDIIKNSPILFRDETTGIYELSPPLRKHETIYAVLEMLWVVF